MQHLEPPGDGKIELRGLTWDDPRGYGPLPAAGEAFADAHPGCQMSVRWDVQPLSGFESRPIVEIAARYDLIVMDHPHTVHAARQGCLLPLGDLPDEFVGRTRTSYEFGGHQWAASIDAACHVSAYSVGCEGAPFRDWNAVLSAAENGLRIAVPLAGVHSLMALLTLIASQGIEVDERFDWPGVPEVESSLLMLRRLCDLSLESGGCESGLDWDPIDALRAVADGRCDYLPLTFGYAHFVDRGVRFAGVPAAGPDAVPRGILGGTGLAVSASTVHPGEAIEYVRFLASSAVQTKCWSRLGGQPAHREAWNQLASDHCFYHDTRPAIEAAFVRPRMANWNAIQTNSGNAIEHWLRSGQRCCHSVVNRLAQQWAP